MSVIRFERRPGAIRTTDDTEEHGYLCAGEFNESAVRVLATQLTPASVVHATAGLLHRQNIFVDEQGFQLWHVAVPYAKGSSAVGSVRFSFTTTGGTAHRDHSRETIAVYSDSPGSLPELDKHGQLVGVRKREEQMEVDGYDLTVPVLRMTYTVRNPTGVVSDALAREIGRATGTVNSEVFRGYLPGELLFLGADGLDGTDAEAELAFHFAAEENILESHDFTIGDVPDTGSIEKDGHDLLWVETREWIIDGAPAQRPEVVWIERIYRRVDFNVLFPFLS